MEETRGYHLLVLQLPPKQSSKKSCSLFHPIATILCWLAHIAYSLGQISHWLDWGLLQLMVGTRLWSHWLYHAVCQELVSLRMTSVSSVFSWDRAGACIPSIHQHHQALSPPAQVVLGWCWVTFCTVPSIPCHYDLLTLTSAHCCSTKTTLESTEWDNFSNFVFKFCLSNVITPVLLTNREGITR